MSGAPLASGEDGARVAPGQLLAGFVFFTAFHAWAFQHFGPQFLDDAYITFRYAERIAAAKGFTYNDGLAILGTTTPLWTLLLASCRVVGMPLIFAVGLLSSLGAAWLCLSIWRLLARFGWGAVGFAGALALLIYERWLFVFLMGMETILATAIVVAIWEKIAARRFRGVGYLGALAFLARPEGAIIALMGLGAAWRAEGRKTALREAILGLAALAPWLVFCAIEFGSPIPHSVAAKQLAHPAGFQHLAGVYTGRLSSDLLMRIACPLAAIGIGAIAGVRRFRPAWAAPVWTAIYFLGLITSGIMFFDWYYAPLAAGIWIVALIGLAALGRGVESGLRRFEMRPLGLSPRVVATVLVLGALIGAVSQSSGFWRRQWGGFAPIFTEKERRYLGFAQEIAPRLPDGTRILVGETGVFGYALPHCEILDSSGINSPEILRIRSEASNSDPGDTNDAPLWVRQTADQLRPDLVLTLDHLLEARLLASRTDREPAYIVHSSLATPWGELICLRRKDFQMPQ